MAKRRNQPESKLKARLPLAFLLLAAAALRFWRIGAKSLWLDEIMSVQKATQSFGGMMKQIKAHDAHPPLFQIVEWLWLRLGQGDGFARMPMALAGVAGVWLSFLVARRLFGRVAAWLTEVMMTVSAFHIYYSQEARLHALILALFLGQVYVLLRILDTRGEGRWGCWAAYAALSLAALYTYALSILAIAALGVAYLAVTLRRGRCQWAQLICAHVLVALLFLPWVGVLRKTTASVRHSVQTLGDERGRPTVRELAEGVASWTVGAMPWSGQSRTGATIGLVVAAVAVGGLVRRKQRRSGIILGVLLLVPLIGYVLLPMPRVHQYDAKHLVFLQPLIFMAIAGMRFPMKKTDVHAMLPAVGAAVLVILANMLMLGEYYGQGYEKENWRDVAHAISPRLRGNDAMVFNPEVMGYAFTFYVPEADRSRIQCLAEAGAPLNRELLYRWRQANPTAPLPQLSPSVRRVWVVQCKNHLGNPDEWVFAELLKLGFTCVDEANHDGRLGYVRWGLFQRGPKGTTPR